MVRGRYPFYRFSSMKFLSYLSIDVPIITWHTGKAVEQCIQCCASLHDPHEPHPLCVGILAEINIREWLWHQSCQISHSLPVLRPGRAARLIS
jgi:hypothetical protein